MNKNKSLLIILQLVFFLAVSFSIFGEGLSDKNENQEVQKSEQIVSNNQDAKTIIDYSDKIIVKPFINTNTFVFSVESKDKVGTKLEFNPNVYANNGVSFSYGFLGFSLSTKTDKANEDEDLYGSTEYFDFIFNYYGSKFGFDLNFIYFKGFYIKNSTDVLEGQLLEPKKIYYDSLEVGALGFNFYYVKESDKLSLSAAFDQTSRQVKSGGSFMMMASYFQIGLDNKNDKPILPNSEQIYYNELGQFRKATSITLSMSPGYGYTFVYKNFYFSPIFFLGLGVQVLGFDVNNEFIGGVAFALKANLKLSFGYNDDKFFAGFQFLDDLNQSKKGNITLTYQIISASLFVGYRF